jgi:ribosomal-protein-alanine N-acetyltransferase
MLLSLETDRLIIREILPTDVIGMFELDSDPEVHKYLGNKPITNIKQALNNIEFIRQQYQDNGIGRWAIIEKETNNFIGWTGFKLITERINAHTNYYDLGYRLIRKYWNNGFATESAKASLDYGFNALKIREVYGMTDTRNLGSKKILEKVGLKNIETFDNNGVPFYWLKITNKIQTEPYSLQ